MSSSSEGDELRELKRTKEEFREEEQRLRQDLEQAALLHKKLSKQCEKARAENTRQQEQFAVLTSGTQALFLHIEKERYRRMGVAWWLCVAMTLLFAVGALQRGSYGWAGLNFVAFLFVWRGLYVQINGAPMAAALCLALLTIKFA